MERDTNNTLLQILAYITITVVLVATIIGFQQTEYKKAEFVMIDQEVTALTDSLEEQFPALQEARQSTQAFVDENLEGA